MRLRPGIAQFEATVLLVVISLSLASVIYAEMREESNVSAEPVFVGSVTAIGGSPQIDRVIINASSPTRVTSLGLDAASSSAGVLAFNGSSYATLDSLCKVGVTTFFSVFASQPGTVAVATDGESWISGAWSNASSVSTGWQEVMIEGGSSCSVTMPGSATQITAWSASPSLSSVPTLGSISGTSFDFFVPAGTGSHTLLFTSTGGFESLEV